MYGLSTVDLGGLVLATPYDVVRDDYGAVMNDGGHLGAALKTERAWPAVEDGWRLGESVHVPDELRRRVLAGEILDDCDVLRLIARMQPP